MSSPEMMMLHAFGVAAATMNSYRPGPVHLDGRGTVGENHRAKPAKKRRRKAKQQAQRKGRK